MSNRCCSGSGLSYSDKLICLYIGKRVSLHYPPKTAGYSSAFLANRKEMQLSQNCSTTIGKYLCVHLQFFLARISQIRHSLHEEGKIKKDLLLLLPSIFSFPPFSSKKCFDLQRNKQCLNCVLGLNNIENQYNGSRCSVTGKDREESYLLPELCALLGKKRGNSSIQLVSQAEYPKGGLGRYQILLR